MMLKRKLGGCGDRASAAVLAIAAMLISGCFHPGPSVKQAMTSAAAIDGQVGPSVPEGLAVGPGIVLRAPTHGHVPGVAADAGTTSTLFDLDKPEVEMRVADFQTNQRGFFDRAMLRGAKYVPTMTELLVREGLPAELAYLPLIESGYHPHAVSHAGAAGPWQFIPETGRRYGLRIDSLVDERRDPIKSTEAAAQYLKELHEMFGDWELSLAAYNSGEYRVARILASTTANDFWDMRQRGYLPNETSHYVPKFLAAVRIASAPEAYGFDTPAHRSYDYETVQVDRQVSLHAAADMCGVSTSELKELNPALRRGVTPSGYVLHVPTGKADPLRIALASYVETVRPVRTVASSKRGGGRRTQVAKSGGRSQVMARRSSARLAKAGKAKPARVQMAAKGGKRTTLTRKPTSERKTAGSKIATPKAPDRKSLGKGGGGRPAGAKRGGAQVRKASPREASRELRAAPRYAKASVQRGERKAPGARRNRR